MILRQDESARSGRKAGAAIWIHQIAKARAGVIMTIVIIVPLNQLHHDTFLPMLCPAHCSSLRMVLDFLPMEEYGEPKDARHHLQGKDNWIGRLFSKSQDIISFQNYMTYVAVNKLDRLKQV